MKTVKVKLVEMDTFYPDRRLFDGKIMSMDKLGFLRFINEEDIKACEKIGYSNDAGFYLYTPSYKVQRSKK